MWERMTIDEYAEFEQANGTTVVQVNGFWWKKIRPFFYQPLFPFYGVDPHSVLPPRGSSIGGFRCVVKNHEMANCKMSYFLFDDIREYSIDALDKDRRWSIRKGQSHIDLRIVSDIDEFISYGHKAYLEFYERTTYSYKKERQQLKFFTKWAETLFRFPKIRILGAYHEGKLSAISVSYLVEDIIYDATFFSNNECMKLPVTDLVIHTIRQEAAENRLVRYIYFGAVTGIKNLDKSKLLRGCKIIEFPAFYRVNPLTHFTLKLFFPREYSKFVGNYSNSEIGEENPVTVAKDHSGH